MAVHPQPYHDTPGVEGYRSGKELEEYIEANSGPPRPGVGSLQSPAKDEIVETYLEAVKRREAAAKAARVRKKNKSKKED